MKWDEMLKKRLEIFRVALVLIFVFACNGGVARSSHTGYELPIFPGAEGFGARTPGGRGGQIIKVTNLNDSGAGSLRTAVTDDGPRIVVFEVSGTIELSSALVIRNPFLTIVGQTAPSPGITLKCNASVGVDIATHDILIQHLRVRGHDSGADDPLRITGGYNIVIDHVTSTWSNGDEVFSISGAVRDISVTNCLFGEAMAYNILIAYGGKNITFAKNLLTSSSSRNPRLGTGVAVAAINNVLYNSRNGAAVGASANKDPDPICLSWVGNKTIPGPQTPVHPQLQGKSIDAGTKIYVGDNVNTKGPIQTSGISRYVVGSPPVPYCNVSVLPSTQIAGYVLKNAGARPADRDPVDRRLIDDVINGTGRWITSIAQVGGFPELAKNTRVFNAGNNPHGDDDGDGYTNVEEIFHQMAAQVEGR